VALYQTPWSVAWLPQVIKAPLRRLHRARVLRRAVDAFRRSMGEIEPSVLRDLVYGWGNEGMSVEQEYLAATITEAMAAKGPILECGTGLSTLVLSLIAERRDVDVWSLEEDDAYGREVAARVARFHGAIRILHAPLTRYGDYEWYLVPPNLPTGFTLVVCDGPSPRCRGGRYGLIPVLGKRLAPGCVILLDDAMRATERAILVQWARNLGTTPTLLGQEKPFAVVTVPPLPESGEKNDERNPLPVRPARDQRTL
jgi:hypothetical protein